MSGDPMDRRKKDIRDEIDFHLRERARELETEGTDPERARQAAVAAFGDPERVAEQVFVRVLVSAADPAWGAAWIPARRGARDPVRVLKAG